MRQRLGIAAALLGDPPVLMLDEPFNGMDPEGIVWMRGFLRSLAAEGRAVLVSSHLMSELQDTAGHLVVVGRGRVIADTSVAELHRRARPAAGSRCAPRAPAEAMAVLARRGRHGRRHRPRHAHRLRPDRRAGRGAAQRGRGAVLEVSAHRATLEEAYLELTRDAVGVPPAAGRTGGGADDRTMHDHRLPRHAALRAGATASRSCCAPSGPSSAPSAAGSSACCSPALLIVAARAARGGVRPRAASGQISRRRPGVPQSADRARRRGGHRQLLLRAPAADRRRQHHRPGRPR